jgi:hypothetical protein
LWRAQYFPRPLEALAQGETRRRAFVQYRGRQPRRLIQSAGYAVATWRRPLHPLQTLGPFAPLQVVGPGALEFPEDPAALSEETPRVLGAREEERAEPELVAQPPRADQIPIRDQPSERE